LQLKYADDTNLLVPAYSDVSLLSEFDHVQQWAADNKMIINISKTKELVALICLRIDMLCVPGVAF